MKRIAMSAGLAAALWLVLPAAASHGSFRGVVLARQPHTLVVEAPSGAVRAVPVTGLVSVGALVVTSGNSARVVGHTDHARFRALVVRNLRSKTVFAAGRTVFTAQTNASGRAKPGTLANVSVRISGRGLNATSISQAGPNTSSDDDAQGDDNDDQGDDNDDQGDQADQDDQGDSGDDTGD